MLRNAVAHGIGPESQEGQERGRAPSPSRCIAKVSSRRGSIRRRRRLNLRLSATRGVSLGMVRADQQLSDEDIMQPILEPGFSPRAR
jgi:chemotaxis protein histidine kinase CheA